MVSDHTFIRTERIEYFKQAQVNVRLLFINIAERLSRETGGKWSLDEVANFTDEEIISYLSKKTLPDKKLIKKRVNHDYIYYFDGKKRIDYRPGFIKLAHKAIQSSIDKNQEIKGTIAYRGIANGKVVKVFGKADLLNVGKGDILMARTTMPDYTPAMERAAAFVTEEGGVTSHAAIIARELKKPCLVGTKNCMHLINEGDEVEVDANKGIIRMLKKK